MRWASISSTFISYRIGGARPALAQCRSSAPGDPKSAHRRLDRRGRHVSHNAILKGLEDHDRVTSVMACGTGKTLTAFWLAERLDARREDRRLQDQRRSGAPSGLAAMR